MLGRIVGIHMMRGLRVCNVSRVEFAGMSFDGVIEALLLVILFHPGTRTLPLRCAKICRPSGHRPQHFCLCSSLGTD